MGREDQNGVVFTIEARISSLDKAIEKADETEKAILKAQKRILEGVKKSHKKQEEALRKQLKAGIIDRKKFAKEILNLEKKVGKQIVKINKDVNTKLKVIRALNRKGVSDDAKKKESIFKRGAAKMKAGLSKMSGGAAIAGAAVGMLVRGFFKMGKASIDVSNKMAAFQKRAEVVFGSALPQVTEAADRLSAAMGLTSLEFLGAAGATADLLIPLGATREMAAEMSVETMELAAALKQFNGDQRSTAEVSAVLTKAFLGEREGLKSLGISISENDIKLQLLKRGTQNYTGESLQLEKALITQELLLKKSGDAMSSYADSADEGQTQTNRLSAEYKEFSTNAADLISTFFRPFEAILTTVFNSLNRATKKLKEFFDLGDSRAKGAQKGLIAIQRTEAALKKLNKIQKKTTEQALKELKSGKVKGRTGAPISSEHPRNKRHRQEIKAS